MAIELVDLSVDELESEVADCIEEVIELTRACASYKINVFLTHCLS